MNKLYFLGLVLTGTLAVSTTAFSQSTSAEEGFNCSQHILTKQLFDANPSLKEEYDRNEAQLRIAAKKLYNNRYNKEEKIYRIPVVFHIIHQNGSENISDEQVRSAIQVFNEEFSKTNAAAANITPFFKDRAADCKIEFRLATIDPNGNCTNGIERFYDEKTVGAGDNVKAGRQWPRQKYLNIYTCASIGSGAAGYAYYPGTIGPDRDGILILSTYVGKIGTGDASRSSALTHEIGHYLSLAHTWGNSNNPDLPENCGDDDGVEDTPNCVGSRTCNLNRNSCDTEQPGDEKDNIQNFMEYAYCYAMFTEGQKARMRAALESTVGERNNLCTEANSAATGVNYEGQPTNLCKADFNISTTKPICEGSTISFSDLSYNSVTTWEWSFPGGTPTTSNEKNPVITYLTAGTYPVSLTVGNGVQSVTTTKNNVVSIVPMSGVALPFAETFETINTNLSPVFSVNNPNNDNTWALFTSAGYQSSKSVYIKNRSISGSDKLDELISNTVDLSTMAKPHLKFRYAYAKKIEGNADELSVLVSNNCGVSWSVRKILKGASLNTSSLPVPTGDFVPSSNNEWREADVNIESFRQSGVRVKFDWLNDGGNNVYLDNINIYDAAVTSIETIENPIANFEVYPNPASTFSSLYFSTSLNGNVNVALIDLLGKPALTIFTGSLAAGEHNYSFKTETLAKGVYLLNVSIDGRNTTKKLIVQ